VQLENVYQLVKTDEQKDADNACLRGSGRLCSGPRELPPARAGSQCSRAYRQLRVCPELGTGLLWPVLH
jgi:hypothetical protein